MSKPDWNCAKTCMPGGHHSITEVPEPVVRFYPAPTKKLRRVIVRITRFCGVGVHYWASIGVEDNLVWWDDAWYNFHDDHEGHGDLLTKQCKTVQEAERWIKYSLLAFPSSEYRYDFENLTDEKWYYSEGD